MAKSPGVDKLGKSFDDLAGGLKALGTAFKEWAIGGKDGAGKAGKGVIGVAGKVGDGSAGVVGSVISGTGKFAQNHTGITAIALVLIAYKPVKMFIDKMRGYKDAKAMNTQNQNLELQYENNLKRTELQNLEIAQEVAARRESASLTSEKAAKAWGQQTANHEAQVLAAKNGGMRQGPPYN